MRRRRERLVVRSARLTRGGENRRGGLTFRLRRRWYLVIDRVELVLELLTIRWYRFVSRVPDLWARRGRGRAARRGALVAAGLSVAIAVTAIAVLPLERDAPGREEASPNDPSPTPEPSTEPSPQASPEPSTGPGMFPSQAPSFDFSTYRNEETGYLFSYPESWDVSTSGTAAVLSDPEDQVVISFDSAPSGSLEEASDLVLQQVTDAYATPEIVATESEPTPEDYPSIVVGGTATDAGGAPIRFIVITIEGPDENRAVLVRFPANTDPEDLGAILEVVGSLRLAPAA
jgi:hypothetical protein